MDPVRQHIVDEALLWQGTTYHHRAHVRDAGADCVGFPLGVALAVGILTEEQAATIPHYSTEWHLHQNEEMLHRVLETLGCVEKPPETRLPGDLLTFQFGRVASHCALLLPQNIVMHALRDLGKIASHRLDVYWLGRLRRCYSMPGVTP